MTIIKSCIIFCIIIANHIANCQDYKGFDDTIQFRINWPGKIDTDDMVNAVKHYNCTHDFIFVYNKLIYLSEKWKSDTRYRNNEP